MSETVVERLQTICYSLYKIFGGKDIIVEVVKEVPIPEPALQALTTIDLHLASSILLDKLEEMGDDKADMFLPDKETKIYDKKEVVEFLGLDETDELVFKPEGHDCDDFAARLFGKGLGLVWTNIHALNWFIDENNQLWFIEPQTDKIARDLENWQGWDIRFFIGR